MSNDNYFHNIINEMKVLVNKAIDDRVAKYTYKPEVEVSSFKAWEEKFMGKYNGPEKVVHTTFRNFLEFLQSYLFENGLAETYQDFLDGWASEIYEFTGTAQEFVDAFTAVATWVNAVAPYPSTDEEGSSVDFFMEFNMDYQYGDLELYEMAFEKGTFDEFTNQFESIYS